MKRLHLLHKLLFLALLGSLGLLAFRLAKGISYNINITPSMPAGIYKVWQRDGRDGKAFERGDLASLCLSPEFVKIALERGYLRQGMCPGGVQALLKEVVAIGGDSFSLTSEGVAVNGRLLENSAPRNRDSNGRPMVFSTSLKGGRIPPGFALLLSRHSPDSFDSRYFGLMPAEAMRHVEPVWTFNSW